MDYSIFINSKDVGRAVQEKAFEGGFKWLGGNSGTLLIVGNGPNGSYINIRSEEEYLSLSVSVPDGCVQIGWQEYIYGSGRYFRSRRPSQKIIYFLADVDSYVYYVDTAGNKVSKSGRTMTWVEIRGSKDWIETDFAGNPLPDVSCAEKYKEVI